MSNHQINQHLFIALKAAELLASQPRGINDSSLVQKIGEIYTVHINEAHRLSTAPTVTLNNVAELEKKSTGTSTTEGF